MEKKNSPIYLFILYLYICLFCICISFVVVLYFCGRCWWAGSNISVGSIFVPSTICPQCQQPQSSPYSSQATMLLYFVFVFCILYFVFALDASKRNPPHTAPRPSCCCIFHRICAYFSVIFFFLKVFGTMFDTVYGSFLAICANASSGAKFWSGNLATLCHNSVWEIWHK